MDIVWSVLESLHFEATTFWCQVALFFVLHFSLTGLVYNPIMKIRDERDSKIGGRRAEADAMAAAARQLKEEFDAKLREARQKGQAQLNAELQTLEEERQKKLAEAKARAREIMEKAEARVAAEREEALGTLEKQVDTVAVSIASTLLKGALDDKDSEPLVAALKGEA